MILPFLARAVQDNSAQYEWFAVSLCDGPATVSLLWDPVFAKHVATAVVEGFRLRLCGTSVNRSLGEVRRFWETWSYPNFS